MNEIALLDLVLEEEMHRDESVIFFATTTPDRWRETFGGRVRTFPISEQAMVGVAVGAAMSGLRPVVDLNRASFTFLTMDQIANHASRIHYMSGGQYTVPLVVSAATRGNQQLGPENEQCPYGMFMQLPGLNVVVPGSLVDACGLLRTALRTDCPVMFFLAPALGEQPGVRAALSAEPIPFGCANVMRTGDAATIVGIGSGAILALAAAEQLADEGGVECDVIDPRTLVPLDLDTIAESVLRTEALVLVDYGPGSGAPTQILASLLRMPGVASALQDRFEFVCAPEVPVPASPVLEAAVTPTTVDIVAAVRRLTRLSSGGDFRVPAH